MGHNTSKGSKSVCPAPDTNGPTIVPLVGNLTFHDVSTIIAGATAGFAAIIALALIVRHGICFSNPTEQKQIIRAIFIVPPFALISFLCVLLDGTPALYLINGLDVAEAFPMAAFFMLITTFVVPDENNRETFFSQMELIDKKGNVTGSSSLQWYRRLSFGVLQWVPMSIILWIATIITEAAGVYCSTSNSPHFAHIWITLIRMLCTIVAITSILRFYSRAKPVLKPKGVIKKLLCFKMLVFLSVLQSFIFNFLKSKQDVNPTKYMTFNDIYNGLPSLILCCEMALIAPFFWFAYPASPYLISRQPPTSSLETGDYRPWRYQGGPMGIYAYLEAINVLDIVKELVQATKARGTGETKERQSSLLPLRQGERERAEY